MSQCICDWSDTCAGLGMIFCEGCGGDQCVCACGGELECPGCPECPEPDDDGYDPDAEVKFQRENPRED